MQAGERGLDPAGFALFVMPWFLTPAFMANHDAVEAAGFGDVFVRVVRGKGAVEMPREAALGEGERCPHCGKS